MFFRPQLNNNILQRTLDAHVNKDGISFDISMFNLVMFFTMFLIFDKTSAWMFLLMRLLLKSENVNVYWNGMETKKKKKHCVTYPSTSLNMTFGFTVKWYSFLSLTFNKKGGKISTRKICQKLKSLEKAPAHTRVNRSCTHECEM